MSKCRREVILLFFFICGRSATSAWLSKTGSEKYNDVVTATKTLWLKKHLPSVEWDRISIIPYGIPKQMFCENPLDILFDDEEQNRNSWTGRAYGVENIMEVLKNI